MRPTAGHFGRSGLGTAPAYWHAVESDNLLTSTVYTMTYGESVEARMRNSANVQRRVLQLKTLAELVGYSREQVRKVVRGYPVVSQTLNGQLCRVLGLDPGVMWQIAQQEKAARRFGVVPAGGSSMPPVAPWEVDSLRRDLADAIQRMSRLEQEQSGIRRLLQGIASRLPSASSSGGQAAEGTPTKRRRRRPATEETRLKISESQRLRWEEKKALEAAPNRQRELNVRAGGPEEPS